MDFIDVFMVKNDLRHYATNFVAQVQYLSNPIYATGSSSWGLCMMKLVNW